MLTAGLLLLGAWPAHGQPASQPAPDPLVHATVAKVHEDGAIVALSAGRDRGVSMGDRFWILGDQNVVATGAVYFLTDMGSAGRLDTPWQEAAAGQPVVLLPVDAIRTLRTRVAPGVSIRGRVSRVAPGLHTAWLDLGRRAGLDLRDTVLVYRRTIPIARGRVELLEDDLSLAALTPLVQNAVTEPGDEVALWPEPAMHRQRRLDSVVLAVTPGHEGAMITLIGTAADGLVEGRLVDLYRDTSYVGVATLVAVSDPLSQARMIEPASILTPEVGDRALVRAPAAKLPQAVSAMIFRVISDLGYCLITAGESDGVEVGERFVVRRPDPDRPGLLEAVAELTVSTVKVDFAGAELRMLRPDAPMVAQWEIAERRAALLPAWKTVGAVRTLQDASRTVTAEFDASDGCLPGDVVCLARPGSDDPVGAIMLARQDRQVTLYVPPGWGDLRHATGAQVSRKVD